MCPMVFGNSAESRKEVKMKSLIRKGVVLSMLGLFILISGITNSISGQENGVVADPGLSMEYGNYASYGVDCGYEGACGVGCEYGLCPFIRDVAHVALSPVYFVASLFSSGVYEDCGCGPRLFRTYKNPCDMCGNWVGNYGGSSCAACSTSGSMMGSFEGSSVPVESFDPVDQTVVPDPMPVRAEPSKENKEVYPPKPVYNKEAAPKAPAKSGASMQMISTPVKVAVRAPQSVQGRQYQEKIVRQNNQYMANRASTQPGRMNQQPMRASNHSYYASPVYQHNVNGNRYQGK